MSKLLILCYQKYVDSGYWIAVPEEYYQDYIEGNINWGGNTGYNQLDLLKSYVQDGFILASSLEQNKDKQTRKYEYDLENYTYLQELYNRHVNNNSKSYRNAIYNI